MLIFQPFGINNYKHHSRLSTELIFGVIALVLVIYLTVYALERFLRPALKKKANIGSLGWYLVEFAILGSFTFIMYNLLGNFHDFVLQSYVLHLLEISSVLVLPFGATLFYFRFKDLEREYHEVVSVSKDDSGLDDLLHLKGEYKKDEIILKPRQILHLASEDNYVGLHYLDGEQPKKFLIRTTLSKMEESLDKSFFLRCSRSHLINTIHVISCQKKKGKIWIKLDGVDFEIPVSRSHEERLLECLKNQ